MRSIRNPGVAMVSSNESNILTLENIKKYIDKSIATIASEKYFQTQMSRKTAFQTLSSTVRITASINTFSQAGVGTGVIISSQVLSRNNKNYYKTYILTNYHVVTTAYVAKIERFHYLQEKNIEEIVSYTGKIIDKDISLDLALIEIVSPRFVGPAAKMVSDEELEHLSLNDPVIVCGCALGDPPIITNGNLVFTSGETFIVSAHSIFGNSGGGLFNTSGKLLGVVNRISAVKLSATLMVPDPNITRVIPVMAVKSWLETNNFRF